MAAIQEASGPGFDVFVSYRRSDGAGVARWLRRELQAFRLPGALRKEYGRRIKVYLDTAYEQGTSDFYERNIRPALLASRYLVVLATPNARRRAAGQVDWIAREVADFAAGPNGANVIAARGAGEFDDPLPADLAERFPNIEIVDLRGAGALAQFNPARAARLASEKLKLVAPVLGIPPDAMPILRREEERRQQTRMGAALGTGLGVVVTVSVLSVFALQSRNQAARALEDSMFASGSMVLLSTQLAPGGNADVSRQRRILINQGCDLLDKLALGSGRQPPIAEAVACRLERGRSHEELKELGEAGAEFAKAIELATDRYAQKPRSDAALALVEARQAHAEFAARSGRPDKAEQEYAGLLRDARRLGEALKFRPELRRAEAEALGQLGDILRARGEHAQAAEHYGQAAAAVDRLLALPGERGDAGALGWLARLHRLAAEQHIKQGDAAAAIEALRASLSASRLVEPAGKTPAAGHEAALAQAMLAVLQRRRGDLPAAEEAALAASAWADRVLASSSYSADLKQRARNLKGWLEREWAAKEGAAEWGRGLSSR